MTNPSPTSTQPSQTLSRCAWVNPHNPEYVRYHDTEWGVPVHNDHLLFELLLLETFQAGLSWECVLNKREAFRTAFHDFIPQRVAAMTPDDEARLLLNPRIIRHRLKIHAAIHNAGIFLDIQHTHGSFDTYLWSWTNNTVIYEQNLTRSPLSDRITADLKSRGMKFLGTTTIYAYLQAVGVIYGHDPHCFLSL